MTKARDNSVHHILAHSYSFYLILLLLSLFLDLAMPMRIFQTSIMLPLGLILLALSSVLVLWAQRTSRHLDVASEVKLQTFMQGPYSYTRTPTHWGLFFLMLGFGLTINAFFVILTTIISFLVTKFVFLKEEEKALATKYGQPYMEYKKLVKF